MAIEQENRNEQKKEHRRNRTIQKYDWKMCAFDVRECASAVVAVNQQRAQAITQKFAVDCVDVLFR